MDLSWNFAAESQAYDRVHRLGQEKDVFVKRLVVEDTIEERMLRLQDIKLGTCILSFHSIDIKTRTSFPGLADAALGEGTGVKLHKLSVREIKAVRVPRFQAIPFISENNVLFVLALRNDARSETSVGIPAAGDRRRRRLITQTACYLSMRSRWQTELHYIDMFWWVKYVLDIMLLAILLL
jgi:hypothetical protein